MTSYCRCSCATIPSPRKRQSPFHSQTSSRLAWTLPCSARYPRAIARGARTPQSHFLVRPAASSVTIDDWPTIIACSGKPGEQSIAINDVESGLSRLLQSTCADCVAWRTTNRCLKITGAASAIALTFSTDKPAPLGTGTSSAYFETSTALHLFQHHYYTA
jgi:hypothetical protein